jgi:hypothetical protein
MARLFSRRARGLLLELLVIKISGRDFDHQHSLRDPGNYVRGPARLSEPSNASLPALVRCDPVTRVRHLLRCKSRVIEMSCSPHALPVCSGRAGRRERASSGRSAGAMNQG